MGETIKANLELLEKGKVKDPDGYVKQVLNRFIANLNKVENERDKAELIKWCQKQGDVIMTAIIYSIKPEFREEFVKLFAVLHKLL